MANERPAAATEDSDPLGETAVSEPDTAEGGVGATLDGTRDAAPKPKGKTKKVREIGDFRIEKRLGKGGMGEVFLATQKSLDRKVAIKTLAPGLAKRADLVTRFIRECRSMAKLHHNNIVQVYAADTKGGINFVAIEYVDGQSLQDWVDQAGKLSVGDALHVLIVCCRALEHALEKSIIHRDVKPDNVLVTADGVVKVADFGLAKALDDDDQSVTKTGAGMGTPVYMAPEQARSAKTVDHRSDVFALGVMLYYLLTGRFPFDGETLVEIIEAKEKGKYTPPRQLEPAIPDRLDLIIGKMIATKPEQRYGDYAELLRDLEGLGLASPSLSFVDAPRKAVLSGSSHSPTSAGSGSTAAPVPSTKPTKKKAVRKKSAGTVGEAHPDQKWLVRYTNAMGKTVVSKMSTKQIQDALVNGMLDHTATVKKSKDGDFLPLAQFPEFESQAARRAASAAAEAKAQHLKGLYEEAAKGEKRRNFIRWIKQMTGSATSMVLFILYLALIGAAIYAFVVYGIPFIRDFVASQVGVSE